jgi:mannosyltransferase OCH1-like enzyme
MKLFQLSYKTDKYQDYFELNNLITKSIDYEIYDTQKVESFLEFYGYNEVFQNLKIKHIYAENAIKCDFIRLCLLYEFGGIYIDADCVLKDLSFIYNLDDNILHIPESRSMYFLKVNQNNPLIKELIYSYISSQNIGYDIEMVSKLQLLKNSLIYKTVVNFIQDKELQKCFEHKKITTR